MSVHSGSSTTRERKRLGERRSRFLRGEEMQDVIYIVLTVVLFGVLALAIRGAERL
jgi:hypothetical protein